MQKKLVFGRRYAALFVIFPLDDFLKQKYEKNDPSNIALMQPLKYISISLDASVVLSSSLRISIKVMIMPILGASIGPWKR